MACSHSGTPPPAAFHTSKLPGAIPTNSILTTLCEYGMVRSGPTARSPRSARRRLHHLSTTSVWCWCCHWQPSFRMFLPRSLSILRFQPARNLLLACLCLLLSIPRARCECGAPSLSFSPFGYHLTDSAGAVRPGGHENRYRVKWCQVGAEIQQDVLLLPEGKFARFTVVDYGSNEGFFSLAIAASFPGATVISVDSDSQFFGVSPLTAQVSHRARLAAANNVLCAGTYSVTMIDALLRSGARPRYSLLLSIFHWLELNGRSEFERTLCMAVQTATTTFIELPEWGKNITQNWDRWQHWYGEGDDMQAVLERALVNCSCSPRVKFIGANMIDYGPGDPSTTTRKTYRIDLQGCDDEYSSSCQRIVDALGCSQTELPSCNATRTLTTPHSELGYCDMSEFSFSSTILGGGYSGTVYQGTWRSAPTALKVTRMYAPHILSEAYSDKVRENSGVAILMGKRLEHVNLNIPRHVCQLPASNETIEVLPLIYGRTLNEQLPITFPIEKTITVALHVARALAYLHAHGIVYYDLHTGQVMLSNGSDPLAMAILLDLDQVQLLNNGRVVCRCWPGDPFFTHVNAPEGLRNCNLPLCTEKVDTYMFGVLLRTLHSSACSSGACRRYAQLTRHCLSSTPGRRPSMSDIVQMLEELQAEKARRLPTRRISH